MSSADLLRELRKHEGLTQLELADLLGVSNILITMIETGQRQVSMKLLKKLYINGYEETARRIFEVQMDEAWQGLTK